MDKEYYREYYRLEREHWWFRARGAILTTQVARIGLANGDGTRILNIGAALGASSEMLRRYGHVTSVEYETECCEFVARRTGVVFVNASITDLPFPSESFDLVCAFDVIEHIDDDRRAVSEMMRVCKRGGAIAVSVPAFMMLWSHHDTVNHHRRRYRLSQLRKLFNRSGRIVAAGYFNSLLFFPIVALRTLTKVVPQRWIRSGAGSDFTLVKSRVFDAVFYRVLLTENIWLRRGHGLPFGVSAFLGWKKSI